MMTAFLKPLSSTHLALYLGAALLTMAVACSQSNCTIAGQKEEVDTIQQPVKAEASTQWVRVIVRLKVADLDQLRKKAAGQKDPMAAKAIDRQIAAQITAVGDQVLQQVEAEGAKVIRRYNALPLLALEVTPRAMATLKGLPEVLAVEPDQLRAPLR